MSIVSPGVQLTSVARRHIPKGLLVLAIIAGGLWAATHRVAGVAWTDVSSVLEGVTVWKLVLLAVIWFGGLAIWATVLAAALPGLGVRRGLLLNLSGSAVANTVPMGGAFATALNWKMAKNWGHSGRSFAAFCVLTNLLDVLTKLVLPLVAVTALLAVTGNAPDYLWVVAAACCGALVLVLVVVVVVHAYASRSRFYSVLENSRVAGVWSRLVTTVNQIGELTRHNWTRLLPGSVLYIATQVLLLQVSLWSVGLHAAVVTVLMAAAIERLGTLIPITPGGAGIAEIGTIAWLVASGLDPAQSVAGVLLYRVFLVVMEIPVGGAFLGGWAWGRRPAARAARDRGKAESSENPVVSEREDVTN